MFAQLKPLHEAFYRIVFRELTRLDAIVLCESRTESEVFKKVAERLGVNIPGSVGVADCEGISNVPRIAVAIASLTRVSRRLRVLAAIVDAEGKSIEERVRSLVSSIHVYHINVTGLQPLHNQVFKANLLFEGRRLPLLIAVNGDFNPPLEHLERHAIEDHVVRLLLLEGRITEDKVKSVDEAKKLIHDWHGVVKLVEKSDINNVKTSFRHIHYLLNMLKEELT